MNNSILDDLIEELDRMEKGISKKGSFDNRTALLMDGTPLICNRSIKLEIAEWLLNKNSSKIESI